MRWDWAWLERRLMRPGAREVSPWRPEPVAHWASAPLGSGGSALGDTFAGNWRCRRGFLPIRRAGSGRLGCGIDRGARRRRQFSLLDQRGLLRNRRRQRRTGAGRCGASHRVTAARHQARRDQPGSAAVA